MTVEEKKDQVRLLDAESAAALIGVPATTIRYWHRTHRLRGCQAGKVIRWRAADVLRYAEELRPKA